MSRIDSKLCRRLRKPYGVFPVLALLLLSFFGCERRDEALPTEGPSTPVPGDTFIEASIGEPNNLLPVLASDSASSEINGLVYNGLVRYDKTCVWRVNWPSRGRYPPTI